MRTPWRRTALAFVLTTVALAVPCVRWFMVGSREIAEEVARNEQNQRRLAEVAAGRLAERLGSRLEGLRETESRRPFYHYQHLCHDPKGAYEGAAVIPSPLAQGLSDPFIRAHFQMDATGRLTMPTINDELPEAAGNQQAAQRAIRQQLQQAAQACLTAMRVPPPVLPQDERPGLSRVEILEATAYEQILQANKLYAAIRSGQAGAAARHGSQQTASAAGGRVEIRVGPFRWHTLLIGGDPALVALREVMTPQGALAQGFIIEPAAVAESLRGARFHAEFAPGQATGFSEAAVPIESVNWRVSVYAAHAIAAARASGREIQSEFFQSFFFGISAASVAGLCVVLLVWQSERLAQQRSQFAASAAHELRTPLAGLRMYGEMLAEGLGDPGRTRDYARRVVGEVERLGRVVTNVLGFSRLERGKLAVRPQRGHLADAVRDCVTRLAPVIEAAGARVELAVQDPLPPVNFDRDAVVEILQNLLDNAEKYTRSAANRLIHVSLAAAANGVTLSVADHGPGVSAHVRRRLFQPFTRGADPDTPAGLGLGLTLVRALSRAQGAEVSYSDAPDGGAVFTVTFPV